MSDRDQHLALVDFNQMFLDSSVWFSRSLLHSIKKLEKSNNILKIKRDGQLLSLLPTYMVSNSLHNSMHIDGTDECPSFSIFYQEQINTGLSYLVFPEISLAVELQSPVLVKWDGAQTLHGTITVDSGITSMFGSAKTLVGKRRKIAEAFTNRIKRLKVNTIFVGSIVFVRDTFLDRSKDDPFFVNIHKNAILLVKQKCLQLMKTISRFFTLVKKTHLLFKYPMLC
uniref:Uncharacterized protein n=1 Tax=Pseudo-nitzschia australis TaxID=44445 RepID=A0A7S4EPQ9_9STRA